MPVGLAVLKVTHSPLAAPPAGKSTPSLAATAALAQRPAMALSASACGILAVEVVCVVVALADKAAWMLQAASSLTRSHHSPL